MRILLAEDDTILADALYRTLAQSTFAVDLVTNGNQADSALLTHTYDLVVLDIGLPGMSGFEVLKKLRLRKSGVPVLILTALDGLADRVRGLDLGADDYLSKPFDLPELEARVRATVRVVDGAKKTLFVSDDGPKIPLEERRRIFERFHRLLGTHTEGSGLGLAIVSEIAALHNAAIVLEDDADGTGNTFTLFFPAPHSIVNAESLV